MEVCLPPGGSAPPPSPLPPEAEFPAPHISAAPSNVDIAPLDEGLEDSGPPLPFEEKEKEEEEQEEQEESFPVVPAAPLGRPRGDFEAGQSLKTEYPITLPTRF